MEATLNSADYFSNLVYLPKVGHENVPSIFCVGLWSRGDINENLFRKRTGFSKDDTHVSISEFEQFSAVFVTKIITCLDIVLIERECRFLLERILLAGAEFTWICEELWAETQIYSPGIPVDGLIVGFGGKDCGVLLSGLSGMEVSGLSESELGLFFENKLQVTKSLL